MNKSHYFSIFLLLVCQVMMAGPARRGVCKTLKLSNGQEVRATLEGDEYAHFWRGDDGRAYALDGDCYTVVDEAVLMAQAQACRAQSEAQGARRSAQGGDETRRYFGEKKSLLILVNFSNITFQEGHDNALFQRIVNETDFKEAPFMGSVADYFRAQSRGQFLLSFDVVGPVNLNKSVGYYGNPTSSRSDVRPAEMVIDALALVKDQVTDWQPYDWDGDGQVDQVYVIYAGQSQSETGEERLIWPHRGRLSEQAEKGDGTGPVEVSPGLVVDSYGCSSELNWKGDISGIGPMCHEFSHCLGQRDFYDTMSSGGQGMSYWDLMHHGEYNNDAYLPSGYTSYERWFLGWLDPIELADNDTTVTSMRSLEDGGECYIIYNKGNRNEYFLLENRQHDGWDAGLPGEGLLILHVDYDRDAWVDNKPNGDYRHQRMTIVPADGQFKPSFNGATITYDKADESTDPFPTASVTAFNRSFMTYELQAKLAAQLFNRNADGTYLIDTSVEDITQHDDGTISFRFVADYDGEAAVLTPDTIDLATVTENCMLKDGALVTGTLGQNVKVSIENGATVTLSGANILGTPLYACQWAGITCMGDATVILASGTDNELRGFYYYNPGISVPWQKTLTIRGDGSLTASSNGYGAGIGGGLYMDCGNIRIEGGTIVATGGDYAAGIGGGYNADCGDITITTGVTSVTAIAGKDANSIGLGGEKYVNTKVCGTVTIGGVETGSISESPFTYIPTHIESLTVRPQRDNWHTLDGRRLLGEPTTKGVYINKGNKVVIR